jgi:FkbM family methyltransferase
MVNSVVTYAQNREDIILSAFFPNIENGFYVDIGAFHPELDSVTKYFYDRGWRGINVEPNKKLHNGFSLTRSRDINLNIGVSNKKGQLEFREYVDGEGLSTFSKDIKDYHSERVSKEPVGRYVDSVVDVERLDSILSEHLPDGVAINFLKVDVEGYEREVLESNNWKKYRPEVLCIEANHITEDWHDLLEGADYDLVFSDGLNEYFIDKHKPGLWSGFNYVEMALGRDIKTPEQKSTYDNLRLHKSAIETLIHKNLQLTERIFFLEHSINESQRLRNEIKGVVRAFDRMIQARLLDSTKRRYKLVEFDVRNASKDPSELIEAAHAIDKASYKSSPGSNRKKVNQVAGRLYVIVKKSAKKIYRKLRSIKNITRRDDV